MELYKISFPPEITEKAYIGISSKGAKRRFQEHCSSKKRYPIVMAIKKYGKENAILTVLDRFKCYEEMYRAEQLAIAEHNTKAPHGFNLTDGGKGAYGLPASDERKLRISEANRGRKASDESRAKMSVSAKRADRSAQVEAMAKANKGRKLSKERVLAMRNVWLGRSHKDESREKMSKSASKRRASDETKKKMSRAAKEAAGSKVFRLRGPCGNLYEITDMPSFCRERDLKKNHMYRVACGKAKQHKGWTGV